MKPRHTEWLPWFAGKKGVWRVASPDRMFGGVPNAGSSKDPKKIRVQITYFRVSVDPDVTISYPENPGWDDLRPAKTRSVSASKEWANTARDFELTCTTEELVRISGEGVMYIDQIIIDTVRECPRKEEPRRRPRR